MPDRSIASTAPGSVLSSAVSEEAPKLAASTWGARLEPPMPHTTTRALPGVAIVAAWLGSSFRADRRYATLLENEVATQTRSLMDSLSATATAERHLRLLMDAVPDAIVVLDRDGRAVDLNEPARRLAARGPNPG